MQSMLICSENQPAFQFPVRAQWINRAAAGAGDFSCAAGVPVTPDFRRVLRHDGDGDAWTRSLPLTRPARRRILSGASQAPQIFMDVQGDVMHDFVHGCLVLFIVDESGALYASLIADRSPLGDNQRNRIKHPLRFSVKP